MTALEARERAEKIWGKNITLERSAFHGGKQPGPGVPEWFVIAFNEGHHLDCNGHTLCHDKCARIEEKL